MKITAKIHRILPHSGRLRAIAEVVLDGEFVIRNVRVICGEGGLFTAMPDYADRNGGYRDHCFPITRTLAAAIDLAVAYAYGEACESLMRHTGKKGSVWHKDPVGQRD